MGCPRHPTHMKKSKRPRLRVPPRRTATARPQRRGEMDPKEQRTRSGSGATDLRMNEDTMEAPATGRTRKRFQACGSKAHFNYW